MRPLPPPFLARARPPRPLTRASSQRAPCRAPVAEVVAPVPKAPRTTIRDWSTAKVTRTLRMANMCNGVVMITIGILLLLVGMVNISFTSITVSAYVVFFGLMLACLECNMSARA